MCCATKFPSLSQNGQSYSINVNDGSAPVIGRASENDDFDKWVSGRIDSVADGHHVFEPVRELSGLHFWFRRPL